MTYAEIGKEILMRNGVFPDYHSAFPYFLKGAREKETESLYMLAECYFHGLGTEKDYKKADILYRLAEKAGHSVDPRIYERLENGLRDLTQSEIDQIVADFRKNF